MRAIMVVSGSCQATIPLPVGPIAICGALASVGGRIDTPGSRLIAPSEDHRSPLKFATRTLSATSVGRSSETEEEKVTTR